MGDWYTIGLAPGLGVALGTLFAGLLLRDPAGRGAAVVLAGAAGALVGLLIEDWKEPSPGPPAAASAAAGAAIVVAGRAAPRRHASRARPDRRCRRRRARRARVRPARRLPRGGRAARPGGPRSPHARPSATRACARLPRTETDSAKALILIVIDGLTPSMLEDAPSVAPPRARAARRARPLPPRRLDVPVADAGLPRLDRDRRAPGRPRDPAPRLVAPRRAAARRVRLVVRRAARRRARGSRSATPSTG